MRRSPILVCSLFVLGVVLGGVAGWGPSWLGLLALGGGGLSILVTAATPSGRLATMVLLGASSLAGGLAAAPGPSPARRELVEAGLARLVADVVESRAGRDRSSSVVEVVRGTRLEGGAAIAEGTSVRIDSALPLGARVRMLARLVPTPSFRNPTPHPPLPSERPEVRGHIPAGARVEVLAQAPTAALREAVRARIRNGLDRSLAPDAAGMARALVLGERGAVDAEDLDAFRHAGLAHVLAVSGLHVAIVAGLALLLFRALLVRVRFLSRRFAVERVAFGLAALTALAFAEIAGGAPSARRAAITAAIAWGLGAMARKRNTPACAAAAIALLAALDPEEAVHPAFLLSVLATLAVATARRPSGPGVVAWLRAALSLSVRATLATAPVVWWCFDGVPLVGVVANVLLVPLGALVVVPLAVLQASVACASPDVATTFAPVFEHVARAFVAACDLLGAVSLGRSLPPLSVPQGMVLAVALLGVILAKRVRVQVGLALGAALTMAVLEIVLVHTEQPRHAVRVTYLDVGQGDAAMVDLPDGRVMVIDAGGGGGDPGKRVLAPLLRARRRDHIDVFVLSHPHPDHYEGLGALLDVVSIGEVWDSGQAEAESRDGPASKLLARARRLGAQVRLPTDLCAHGHRFGAATIDVLAPCPHYDSGYDPNDNSMVLRVRYGRRVFLFSGDAEAHEESVLAESRVTLRADVLKVGHHGSRTSSTQPFLAAVAPQIALVSAGAANRFGHPHREVIDRLASAGAHVVVTASEGGTLAWTDGQRLTITPWHGAAFDVR